MAVRFGVWVAPSDDCANGGYANVLLTLLY